MARFLHSLLVPGLGVIVGLTLAGLADAAEWNPVRTHSVQLGPEAARLIVGFRATDNAAGKVIRRHSQARGVKVIQAQTSAGDVSDLLQRAGIPMAGSRQMTPSMHVVFLPKTLYGADVEAALTQLRADPAVEFAEVDQRRHAHALTPNDPYFAPPAGQSVTADGATGQWYLETPSTVTGDAAATDAVSAWSITTGSTGTVIADVDSGVRFDHPDLLRAGFGGRLLPGYDFVSGDQNRTTGASLGTFLMANDGDGWDPDPSDPGDWVSAGDLMNTAVFPPADCGDPNSTPVDGPVDSSWHGTRVVGVMGAIANNSTGIAGMTWNPYILPVRSLGKCGGFDSDIITGMEWAAGMSVTGVPDNPYPADIINLSLGGSSGTCPSDYQSVITTLTGMGVLIVASAGNQSGPVDAPGICPGVLAVAGLRNVGTKVGYSSLGPQVGISAPAGNCVNTSGACLRSIDTTTNSGTTTPGDDTYTNQSNVNLGTSFSAPIVSGIAALMRSVNANLTPAQLIARIKSSALPFPQPAGVAQCSSGTSSSVECACTSTTCGAGMINALTAVQWALHPIAAVTVPAGFTTGSATLDAGASVAACSVAGPLSYAWSASGGVSIVSGANSAQVMVKSTGTAGLLSLLVTDSAGATDTATISFSSSGASTTAPSSPGTSATACVAPMTVTPAAPTLSETFSPASVAINVASTLTVTLSNSNAFALTQSGITLTMPAGLTIQGTPGTSVGATPGPATTCTGAALSLTNTTTSLSLSDANIPASGRCTVTLSVIATTVGDYTHTVGSNALVTGPAGANTDSASASLSVTAAAAGGGHGGGLDQWDLLFLLGAILAGRREVRRALAT